DITLSHLVVGDDITGGDTGCAVVSESPHVSPFPGSAAGAGMKANDDDPSRKAADGAKPGAAGGGSTPCPASSLGSASMRVMMQSDVTVPPPPTQPVNNLCGANPASDEHACGASSVSDRDGLMRFAQRGARFRKDSAGLAESGPTSRSVSGVVGWRRVRASEQHREPQRDARADEDRELFEGRQHRPVANPMPRLVRERRRAELEVCDEACGERLSEIIRQAGWIESSDACEAILIPEQDGLVRSACEGRFGGGEGVGQAMEAAEVEGGRAPGVADGGTEYVQGDKRDEFVRIVLGRDGQDSDVASVTRLEVIEDHDQDLGREASREGRASIPITKTEDFLHMCAGACTSGLLNACNFTLVAIMFTGAAEIVMGGFAPERERRKGITRQKQTFM
ncbi:hypothetical protein HK101_003940, partial [Irineochytrium annulatum]